MSLKIAHDNREALQYCVESFAAVERAFGFVTTKDNIMGNITDIEVI